MASFEVTCDIETGIVNCRFNAFVPDAEVDDLVKELTRAILAAQRRYGRLRMLVDNRDGAVFSTNAAAAVSTLKSIYKRTDRVAALVPTGLRKLQAQRNSSDQTRVFVSEAEAIDWLRSGEQEPTG